MSSDSTVKTESLHTELDIEDVKSEYEELEQIDEVKTQQFSYTLNLSINKSDFESSLCQNDSITENKLEYVKLNSDNTIETNAENPWALTENPVPRSLERYLSNKGFEVREKKVNRSCKFSPRKIKKVEPAALDINDISYLCFQNPSNNIVKSSINPVNFGRYISNIQTPSSSCVNQESIDNSDTTYCESQSFTENTETEGNSNNLCEENKENNLDMNNCCDSITIEPTDILEITNKKKEQKMLPDIEKIEDSGKSLTEQNNISTDSEKSKKKKKKKQKSLENIFEDGTNQVFENSESNIHEISSDNLHQSAEDVNSQDKTGVSDIDNYSSKNDLENIENDATINPKRSKQLNTECIESEVEESKKKKSKKRKKEYDSNEIEDNHNDPSKLVDSDKINLTKKKKHTLDSDKDNLCDVQPNIEPIEKPAKRKERKHKKHKALDEIDNQNNEQLNQIDKCEEKTVKKYEDNALDRINDENNDQLNQVDSTEEKSKKKHKKDRNYDESNKLSDIQAEGTQIVEKSTKKKKKQKNLDIAESANENKIDVENVASKPTKRMEIEENVSENPSETIVLKAKKRSKRDSDQIEINHENLSSTDNELEPKSKKRKKNHKIEDGIPENIDKPSESRGDNLLNTSLNNNEHITNDNQLEIEKSNSKKRRKQKDKANSYQNSEGPNTQEWKKNKIQEIMSNLGIQEICPDVGKSSDENGSNSKNSADKKPQNRKKPNNKESANSESSRNVIENPEIQNDKGRKISKQKQKNNSNLKDHQTENEKNISGCINNNSSSSIEKVKRKKPKRSEKKYVSIDAESSEEFGDRESKKQATDSTVFEKQKEIPIVHDDILITTEFNSNEKSTENLKKEHEEISSDNDDILSVVFSDWEGFRNKKSKRSEKEQKINSNQQNKTLIQNENISTSLEKNLLENSNDKQSESPKKSLATVSNQEVGNFNNNDDILNVVFSDWKCPENKKNKSPKKSQQEDTTVLPQREENSSNEKDNHNKKESKSSKEGYESDIPNRDEDSEVFSDWECQKNCNKKRNKNLKKINNSEKGLKSIETNVEKDISSEGEVFSDWKSPRKSNEEKNQSPKKIDSLVEGNKSDVTIRDKENSSDYEVFSDWESLRNCNKKKTKNKKRNSSDKGLESNVTNVEKDLSSESEVFTGWKTPTECYGKKSKSPKKTDSPEKRNNSDMTNRNKENSSESENFSDWESLRNCFKKKSKNSEKEQDTNFPILKQRKEVRNDNCVRKSKSPKKGYERENVDSEIFSEVDSPGKCTKKKSQSPKKERNTDSSVLNQQKIVRNDNVRKSKSPKKGKNLEKTVLPESEDIFSGIFTKRENSSGSDTNLDLSYNTIDIPEICENNFFDTDEIRPEDNKLQESFSFSDILSQSHNERLKEKLNEIINKSNVNGISKSPEKQETSNSIEKSPKDPKKQTTLDRFFVKSYPEERRMKKQKALELLQQDKTIMEIEEELEISQNCVDESKIGDLSIEIPVPLIHRIANLLGNNPTEEQRKQLEDAGIKLKLGKFTKEEDEKLRQRWKQFCKEYDWDENDPSVFINGSTKAKRGVLTPHQFRKFVQYISYEFSDRVMINIYKRFKRLFSNVDKSNYSNEDDQIIEEYLASGRSLTPYADLSKILERDRYSIAKHFRLKIANEKNHNSKVLWTKELTIRLFANLVEVTRSISLSELKDREITPQEWRKISDNMQIPAQKLQRSWRYNFYPRLYSANYDQEIGSVKIKLINLLDERYNDFKEIDWNEVSKEFSDGFTANRLGKLLHDLLSKKVPSHRRQDFKKSIKILKKSLQEGDLCRKKFPFLKDILNETENGTVFPKFLTEKKRYEEIIDDYETDEEKMNI